MKAKSNLKVKNYVGTHDAMDRMIKKLAGNVHWNIKKFKEVKKVKQQSLYFLLP